MYTVYFKKLHILPKAQSNGQQSVVQTYLKCIRSK